MTAPDRIARVRFAGKDFATFFNEIVGEVSTYFGDETNDLTESGLGVMFIDIVAFALDTMAYYLDLEAGESFLETAQLENSIVLLARQLGYSVRGSVSSSTNLRFTVNSAYAFDVPIPKGFPFQGPNQLVFEVVADTVIPANTSTPVQLAISEGETLEERFRSDGTANQRFFLTGVTEDKSLVQDSMQVLVDGNEAEVVDFLEFRADLMVEMLWRTDPPEVRFGDGSAGAIPAEGAEIRVIYRVGHGELGEAAQNTIVTARQPLVVNGQTIQYAVTNLSKATGGAPAESFERARSLAPKVFRAQHAAVTASDIESLSTAFVDGALGAVRLATAVSVRGVGTDLVFQVAKTTMNGFITFGYPAAYFVAGKPLYDALNALSGSENAAVVAAVATIQTQLGTDKTNLSSVITLNDTAITSLALIGDEAGKLVGSAFTTALASLAAQSSMATVVSDLSTLRTTVDAITTAGTDQLTSGSKTALLNGLNGVISALNAKENTLTVQRGIVQSMASSVSTAITTAVNSTTTTVGNASTVINATLVMTDGYVVALGDIDDLADLLSPSAKTDTQTALTELLAQIATHQAGVAEARDDLEAHLTSILANDSKANVVQVYILTINSDGFYDAPSEPLLLALQNYLDVRKESTVTVEVVDGSPQLVLVDMEIELKIESNHVEADIVNTATAIANELLRGRAFGKSLRLSDVYKALELDGVEYVHVTIQGPALYLTVDGDLVIDGSKVLSKGTLTVNAL